jgi:hypothetical protein
MADELYVGIMRYCEISAQEVTPPGCEATREGETTEKERPGGRLPADEHEDRTIRGRETSDMWRLRNPHTLYPLSRFRCLSIRAALSDGGAGLMVIPRSLVYLVIDKRTECGLDSHEDMVRAMRKYAQSPVDVSFQTAVDLLLHNTRDGGHTRVRNYYELERVLLRCVDQSLRMCTGMARVSDFMSTIQDQKPAIAASQMGRILSIIIQYIFPGVHINDDIRETLGSFTRSLEGDSYRSKRLKETLSRIRTPAELMGVKCVQVTVDHYKYALSHFRDMVLLITRKLQSEIEGVLGEVKEDVSQRARLNECLSTNDMATKLRGGSSQQHP